MFTHTRKSQNPIYYKNTVSWARVCFVNNTNVIFLKTLHHFPFFEFTVHLTFSGGIGSPKRTGGLDGLLERRTMFCCWYCCSF